LRAGKFFGFISVSPIGWLLLFDRIARVNGAAVFLAIRVLDFAVIGRKASAKPISAARKDSTHNHIVIALFFCDWVMKN